MKKRKAIKKEKKTEGFWHIMFQAIKEAHKKYKIQMKEAVEKKRLLNSHSDWSLLEFYIQKVNENPKLRVRITLNDGTVLNMDTFKKETSNAYELLEF